MKTKNQNSGVPILIAEDSRTQAEYLQHILECEGYPVDIAADGNEALEKIRIRQPKIVLTDIIMPEMDGYDLCRAIKRNKDLAHIPVILVTQLFDPADLIKGLEAGADNIIIKPFEPGHVISRITSTLQSPVRPGSDGTEPTLEVSLEGKTHHIPASHFQTPAILLSTYEHALKKNTELQEAHDRLIAENENLHQQLAALERERGTSLSSGSSTGSSSSPASARTATSGQTLPVHGSEERFRKIAELSPIPLAVIDSSHNFRFLNREFEEHFGYTLNDIPTEKDWLSTAFRNNARSKILIQHWKQELECADEERRHTFPITGKDGSVHQVEIYPIPLPEGELLIVFQDLLDKRESNRLRSVLESIVNSSNDAIIGKSLDGTIMSWNRAAERYYGYLAEEVIGKSIDLIVPPELREQLALFLKRVGNGETIDRFDTIRLKKDGSRIEVCVTLSPIRNDDGQIIGISTIAQNIAERKKYEVSRMFNQQVLHRR